MRSYSKDLPITYNTGEEQYDPQPCFFLNVRYQVPHPNKTTLQQKKSYSCIYLLHV